MINVLIADDHKIVVDGLVSILENEEDIKVVGTAHNGDNVLPIVRQNHIDIAILDIEMPGKTGVELTKYFQERYPAIKVLILTMYKTEEIVKQIVNAGAKGFILKNKGSDELVKAIRHIQEGHSYIGQEISTIFFDAIKNKEEKAPLFKLTKREKEVLQLISKGLTSVQIGKKLFIAPSTVDTHRRNLIDKIGVANSKELIIYALKNKKE